MPSFIPTPKIIERIQFENLWWIEGHITPIYAGMKRRLYFDLFYPFVQDISLHRAVLLMGLVYLKIGWYSSSLGKMYI